MEAEVGIEPTNGAWEAHILPLNHTRTESLLRCYQTPSLAGECRREPYRLMTILLKGGPNEDVVSGEALNR